MSHKLPVARGEMPGPLADFLASFERELATVRDAMAATAGLPEAAIADIRATFEEQRDLMEGEVHAAARRLKFHVVDAKRTSGNED